MAKTKGPAIPRHLQPNYDALVDRETPTLDRLSALYSVTVNLDDFQKTLVNTARTESATWEQIGAALSVTKQAAQKRYSLWPTDD